MDPKNKKAPLNEEIVFKKGSHIEQALLVIIDYLQADTVHHNHAVDKVKDRLIENIFEVKRVKSVRRKR